MAESGIYVDLPELLRFSSAARGLSLSGRQAVQSVLRGRAASRLRGPGLDFEELRAYQPGDDIRSMDWRVTARTRTPFVRVYREEKERPVLLVVDQRASMFFGSVRDMKSVVAARAAAIVAHRVVASGDRIGAVVFGDESSKALRPQRSSAQVMRILEELVRFNAALPTEAPPDHTALDQAMSQVLRLATHNHLVVLVSDLTGAGESTRKIATQIRRKNDLVLLHVTDPLEKNLPRVGEATLGDGRLQVQVNTNDARVRERFSDDVAERRQRADSFALQYDVPVLELSTDTDVLSQLRAQLALFQPGRRG